jgi:hypothetical protein
MKRTTVVFFCVSVLFLSGLPARADVAPDPLYKGMTPARKDSRVQMVSQNVAIDLGADWCRVEADFVLHNRSRSPASMEVGFPTGYKDEVKDLRVFRNGEKVKIRNDVEHETWEEDQEDTVYHWALWDMRFAPDERVSLRVAYSVKPRKNHDYLISRYRQHLPRIEKDFEGKGPMPAEVKRVMAGMTSYSTGYVMVTGAGWHGPIEKATVIIRHPEGPAALRWIDPPDHFTVMPEGITWHFTFIDPDFDVDVEFSENATLDEEIALVQDALTVSEAGRKEGLSRHLDYLKGLKRCLAGGGCGSFQ